MKHPFSSCGEAASQKQTTDVRTLTRPLFGDESCVSRYPRWNTVIALYSGVSIVVFALYIIAPFLVFISSTPFYHLQRYLGIIGVLLLAVDFFTNKGLWRGAYVGLLYGILAVSLFASVRWMEYGGVKNNLYTLCWSAVQFGLLYSCAYRFDAATLGKIVKHLYFTLLAVYLAACLASLYLYVLQKGYTMVIDAVSADQTEARLGFYGNRLFGVFNPINHAAYTCLLLLLGGAYYYRQSRKKATRAALLVSAAILLAYIILCASRSAWVALFTCIFLGSFLLVQNRTDAKDSLLKNILLAAGITILSAAVFFLYRGLLKTLPILFKNAATDLTRKGLEDDTSNGRLAIWRDYCSLYKEIGLTGLSPGNYMQYIAENFPDLYIVDYIRTNYPEKFAGGVIYHTHNGYLKVFVSAGWLGLACLLAYLGLMAARCAHRIFKEKSCSEEWIFSLLIVIAGLISALFDRGIFLDSNPQTMAFWLFAGIVGRYTAPLRLRYNKQKIDNNTD